MKYIIILSIFIVYAFADLISKIPDKNIQNELQRKIYNEQNKNKNDKQDEFTVEKIFLNSGIESTAGALGKTYKNIGELLELKPVINYGMDIGASQSFKPVMENYIGTDDKEESK